MRLSATLAWAVGLTFAIGTTADALTIKPSTGTPWVGTSAVTSFDENQIATLIGAPVGSLMMLLSSVPGAKGKGTDSGAYANSYEVRFNDTVEDPSDAVFDYKSGAQITGAGPLYLAVNGNYAPYWYVFDITGWNGKDDLKLQDFFPKNGPAGGSITEVSILRGGIAVPDAGATIVLLGLGLGAFSVVRRRFS